MRLKGNLFSFYLLNESWIKSSSVFSENEWNRPSFKFYKSKEKNQYNLGFL